jgi:hypothetical protein
MPASKPVDSASARATGSGVHASGPIGTPQMRDIAQTPMIPALSNTPAVRSCRDGRKMTPTAHASWSQAAAAKKPPCSHDIS